MNVTQRRMAKTLAMVAALSGGSLFVTCVGRVRTAAIDGATSFLFSELNQAGADFISNLTQTETNP